MNAMSDVATQLERLCTAIGQCHVCAAYIDGLYWYMPWFLCIFIIAGSCTHTLLLLHRSWTLASHRIRRHERYGGRVLIDVHMCMHVYVIVTVPMCLASSIYIHISGLVGWPLREDSNTLRY